MRENFDAIPTDILENMGVLRSLKENFDKQRAIYAPDPENFKEIIPSLIIEDDLERVEKKKEGYAQETEKSKREKMTSDIFEGIVVDQFSGSWLANKAEGHYTSEADDLFRGVDVVAEIISEEEEGESNYLGFALDVTYSETQETVEKKLEGIWNYDVSKSKLSDVRYFENEDFKGALSLPRIVVSANRDTVRELIRMCHLKDRKGLEEHDFQYSLLSQIKVQLESYYKYAEVKGTERYKEVILESLQSFYQIYDSKEAEIAEKVEKITSDPQFNLVKDFCQKKLEELTK